MGPSKHRFGAAWKVRFLAESRILAPIHLTSSGQGTMVDFTVVIAIASAIARPILFSENG